MTASIENSIDRLYRTLVENFPNGIVTIFDRDHRYLIVGGAKFQELSISADDLEGHTLEEVFPDQNVERIKPLYEEALSGEYNVTEVELEERIFKVHILPVYGEEDEVIAGMTMSQEITDQRRYQTELENARKRYQTLIETAPDPIFVADPNSGKIIEVNTAAEELRNQPQAEIIGIHQSELHPPDRAAEYRQLFAEHVEGGGVRRKLSDGSQIYVVTADGDEVPVEISATAVSLEDQDVIFGVFRDITDQLEYERALTALNKQTGQLLRAETTADIGHEVIAAATGILDLPAVVCYRFDQGLSVLEPLSHSAAFEAEFGEPEPVEPGDGTIWQAFLDGETTVKTADTDDPPGDGFGYAGRDNLIVPLSGLGLIIASRSPGSGFDNQTVELVEILANSAEAALERTDRERALRERDRELEQRTAKLEELEAINSRIREITQSLVQSDSREEIEQTVCSVLAGVDNLSFVWIGEPDAVTNELQPRSWAGDGYGYLEQFSLAIEEGDDPEPSIETMLTGSPTIHQNTGRQLSPDSWGSHALTRGFRSVMSIPLTYKNVSYGVLSLYAGEPGTFNELLESVLVELGDTIAYAINAIKRKHAVLAEESTELEFEITDTACLFLRFAQDTGCTIQLEGLIPQDNDAALVLIRVKEGSVERLIERATRSSAVEDPQEIGDAEGLIQMRFIEPFIATILADHGIDLRRITADNRSVQVTVRVPPTLSVHQAFEVIRSTYDDSRLLAKREETESLEEVKRIPDRFLEGLTKRQRQAIELAYHGGYFERPKGATGSDIADAMDLSSSAFHNHLRAAEQKLFASIFDDTSPSGLGGDEFDTDS